MRLCAYKQYVPNNAKYGTLTINDLQALHVQKINRESLVRDYFHAILLSESIILERFLVYGTYFYTYVPVC